MKENIDSGLENLLANVPPTIEDALFVAVDEGRMTVSEARDCWEAYNRTFNGLDEPLELPQNWA